MEPRQQLRLGPAKPQGGVQVPDTVLGCFALLQQDHVLGPAQPEDLLQEFWLVPIGPCEGPHPPEVPGGEALPLRISGLEVLRRYHCRALLRPGTDRLADGKIEGRLRQGFLYELIQYLVKQCVVRWLSYIHKFPPPFFV